MRRGPMEQGQLYKGGKFPKRLKQPPKRSKTLWEITDGRLLDAPWTKDETPARRIHFDEKDRMSKAEHERALGRPPFYTKAELAARRERDLEILRKYWAQRDGWNR